MLYGQLLLQLMHWEYPLGQYQQSALLRLSPFSHIPFPSQGVICDLMQDPSEHEYIRQVPAVPEHPLFSPLNALCTHTNSVSWPHKSSVHGFLSSHEVGHVNLFEALFESFVFSGSCGVVFEEPVLMHFPQSFSHIVQFSDVPHILSPQNGFDFSFVAFSFKGACGWKKLTFFSWGGALLSS